MKAILKYLGTSPQKARLVADLIRGKSVEEAQHVLRHSRRAAARDMNKLLMSAVANAVNNVPEGEDAPDPDDLFVRSVRVDMAPSLKRIRPRAMGRAYRVLKRHCHIRLELDRQATKA
jgi:large subunit ribosomal protein L22